MDLMSFNCKEFKNKQTEFIIHPNYFMKSTKSLLLSFLLLGFNQVFSQTSTTDGSWQNNSNWNTTYPGSGTDGDGTLNLDGETINFNNYITLGTNNNDVNVAVANSNFAGEFIVNDTLVIFGDVSFENKAMELTVTSNGVFIVFGSLSMNNQISVASDGLMVVTETFTMSGSGAQNDYSGAGNVYAGSYAGNAEAEIDASGDGSGDSSFTIDDLSTDGFETIEEFVGGGGTTPLPVELLYFTAVSSEDVTLSWSTSTEINNDYFLIERSEDGSNFYEIGRINGNGNSSEVLEYSFIDRFVYSSIEYYRIKQVDFDGQFEYFKVLQVTTNVEDQLNEIVAYPTTVQDNFLKISSSNPMLIRDIKFFNLSGGLSKNLIENATQLNSLNYQINISDLEKGIYLVKLTTSEGQEYNSQIILK